MTFVVITVTTITCDGSSATPCPAVASAVFEHPQSVAIRLARKQGWLISADTLCPACSNAEVAAVPVSPWPLATMMAPATLDALVPG
jgi:hypothetical protein